MSEEFGFENFFDYEEFDVENEDMDEECYLDEFSDLLDFEIVLDRKIGALTTCENFIEALKVRDIVEKYDGKYLPLKPSVRFVQGADSYGRDITKALNKDGFLSFYLVSSKLFTTMMKEIGEDQNLNWWDQCTLN